MERKRRDAKREERIERKKRRTRDTDLATVKQEAHDAPRTPDTYRE